MTDRMSHGSAVVWAPLSYEAVVTRPRKRGTTTAKIGELVPIDVRRVTYAEAPISIRIAGQIWPRPFDRLRDFRAFDGRTWRRLHDSERSPLTLDRLNAQCEAVMTEAVDSAKWRDFPWGRLRTETERRRLLDDLVGTPRTIDRHEIRQTVSDNREIIVAEARQRAADELLVVEDEVWGLCDEPSLMFSMPAEGQTAVDVFPYAMSALGARPHSSRFHFRLDRMDAVERFLGSGMTARLKAEIEILQPGLLAYDERLSAVNRFLQAVSDRGVRADIRKSGPEAIRRVEALDAMWSAGPGPHFDGASAMSLIEQISIDMDRVSDEPFRRIVAEILASEPFLADTASPDDERALALA